MLLVKIYSKTSGANMEFASIFQNIIYKWLFSFIYAELQKNIICWDLNTDPSANADYKTLDYAFYLHTDGNVYCYESGGGKGKLGTYGVGTQFTITYDNSVIRYFINGIQVRSVSAGSGKRFYFDSSLLSVHSTPITTSLFFGPMGMQMVKRVYRRSNGAKVKRVQ